MKVSVTQLCRFFVTPWTVAHQAPLFMQFSRQEYWSGLPCPSPGDLSKPVIEPESLMSPALAGGFFTWGAQRYTKHLPYARFHSRFRNTALNQNDGHDHSKKLASWWGLERRDRRK